MLDEKTLQERVNRRLSGLRADELRRMRIRAVVQQERSAKRSFLLYWYAC